MSNVTSINRKFDQHADTALNLFRADDTAQLPALPWSALLQGPASDPEIRRPLPAPTPRWVKLVCLVAALSTTYLVGIIQGVLTTRGLQ